MGIGEEFIDSASCPGGIGAQPFRISRYVHVFLHLPRLKHSLDSSNKLE